MPSRHLAATALASALLACAALVALYGNFDRNSLNVPHVVELAAKTSLSMISPALKFARDTTQLVPITPPPMREPWSAPDNLFVFWSGEVDKVVTAESVRHIVKIGTIDGGEYRSPQFVHDLSGQKFRDLTLTCCSVLLFPPLDHGFPIYQLGSRLQRRISRYVANGNTMIFTGDMMGTMFINTIFGYNLEPVPHNYDAGPFMKYQPKKLPDQIKKLPDILRQENTAVSVMDKESLPIGTTVFYASPGGSPFFSIKYCEVMNPKEGEPPIKISPHNCDKWKKKHGKECGCGNIIYVGFDFADTDSENWNDALRASLTLVIGKDES